MTTKDYVYLSLLVVTAMVFYLNGYFAGITGKRKVATGVEDNHVFPGDACSGDRLEPTTQERRNRINSPEEEFTIRAVFGRN
jgi:hypothetical protein